jgi:acetate kinase
MRVLAVNAGSSSLKLSLVEGGRRVDAQNVDAPDWASGVDEDAVAAITGRWAPVDAVGHRIVHGGTEFVAAVVVDDDVRRRLGALTELAPLHQPKSLSALDLTRRLLPDTPAVACFDTAFHATIPVAASTYALPAEWRRLWPLRRFGFHGLSHAYASARASALSGRPISSLRIVTCHLGAGASLAAVLAGASVDTTMGFTPLEGLVMATRSGNVDPGLVLWLEQHAGMDPDELATVLEHRSGLLGLCGHADMKEVLQAEQEGDEDAAMAVAVYLHRLRAGIAAMATATNGLDVLVFTGGVGERAPSIRSRAARGLEFLGLRVDEGRNCTAELDAEITEDGSAVRTFVLAAREDVQIARELEALLPGVAGTSGRKGR